ncbi:MAG TPA: DUF547 domain-containing protein [Desulfocapsa sulfexigens]|nr:DUF547 domain-containing protein [Desulfocapsa sulfexigens]
MKNNNLSLSYLLATLLVCNFLWTGSAQAAPSADLWPLWQTSNENSTQVVDHSLWNALLGKYLVTDHPSAINRFKYATVTKKDQQSLNSYLTQLQKTKVRQLNRIEQKAFWINLYNGLTIKVILDHYPVKSIMDIDISPGFFSNGPWDAKLFNIQGEDLSLNDIEHRILRPIFSDNRVHYALNCASLGCPNLQDKAFTATNMEQLLNDGARTYINHPRGAQMIGGKLKVSSIYKWFQADFGGSREKVVQHLQQYAEGDLNSALSTYKGKLNFDYNWDLNE